MSRIFYFCPDFPQPSGGIKTLYRHVHRLCELGFDAAIVHQKQGFTLDWHGYHVPTIWLTDRPQFRSSDIWVLPEVMADFAKQSQSFPGQRVVIALSWSPAYNRLCPGERWQDFGITHVITKSPVIQRYLEWSMEIDVTLIAEVIDSKRYFYVPYDKRPKINYITRKDKSSEWVRGVLMRKGEPFTDYEWMPLRGMDETTYAQHLREAAIFLTTTTQEGMHVSILEAMACGCLVVGYSGIGGAIYMEGEGEEQNCLLVENGNLPELGRIVEQAMQEMLVYPQRYEWVVQNGLVTARRYQDVNMESESLLTFFDRLVNDFTGQ